MPAPHLHAFLVRDAEKPAAELGVFAQAADVAHGGQEGFLDNVQARLFVAGQFENINIQRQLVAPKENAPGLRFPGFGLLHRQLFAFSHYQHLHEVECPAR